MMTPEKRKKITALMNNSESTENEKQVCRKLLKDNPEKVTEFRPTGEYNPPDSQPSLEDLLAGFGLRNQRTQQEEWLRQSAAQQASAQWQEEMRFRADLAQQLMAQQRAASQAAPQGQWQHPLADCGFVVEEKPPGKKSIFDGLLGYLWRKK